MFSDFTPAWYAFISPYFVNFFLVAIILPWLNLFKCMIFNAIRRCYIKSNIREMLQKQADRLIVGYQFDIAAQSALIVLNTTICFTYSTSIPLLPILHLISIISVYITDKICLLRYSRRVSIDEDMNNIIVHTLPFIVILNIAFSIWALTVDTLFPEGLFQNVSFHLDILGQSEFRRTFYFLPLTICLFIVVVFLIVDYILIRLFGLCCCRQSDTIFPEQNNRVNFFSHKIKGMNMLHSYKLHKNPDYKHVIENVDRLLH